MPWILTHLVLVAGFALGIIGLVFLLQQPRQRQGNGKWLFWMLVLPYVAVPLYLFIGGRKYRKLIREKGGVVFGSIEEDQQAAISPIDSLLRHFDLPGACGGNALQFFQSGEATYHALMDQIESARESIFIQTFVFKLDPVGRSILEALTRRAREGIAVHLMIDGFGSMHTKKRSLKSLVDAGGHVAVFLPVIRIPFKGNSNTREHRKIAIFDCTRVIAGGSNLAEEYIGPDPMPGRWQDINFLLEGPAVRHYLAIFRSDWAFAVKAPLPASEYPERALGESKGDQRVQVIPSGPDIPKDSLYYTMLTAAATARSRLWIASPYFVPDSPLCQAIALAAYRGVDVRVIVPSKSNHSMTDLARRTYLREVLDHGGRIIRYTGGMFHGKTVIVDDEFAMVGSMNADRRSLFINFEVMLGVYDGESIAAIEEWNRMLMSNSMDGIRPAGRVLLLFERCVGLLAPQL